MSCYELFDRSETSTAELAGDLIRAFKILINHTNQTHWFALLSQLMVDARVITSKCSHADDGCVDEVAGGQLTVLIRCLLEIEI
jgi:hypothetical protein